ncbi:hypothetical protein PG996_002255 [Apiospora saccharicola]|uniref:C3H1-type domain-containing protein n=1 Tax=Apiospora saccharicola TaxID=335842 RepID=A0ABR1WIY3_9PEZI
MQRSIHAGGGSSSTRLLQPLPSYNAAHPFPFPQHFLVRPSSTKHTASGTITTPGPMVPLIAVDQLPEWIDIAGVPRELTVEQTMGLKNLGNAHPETVDGHKPYYDMCLHQGLQLVTSSDFTPAALDLKHRSGAEARDGKNGSASVDAFDTDLLGSVSSSKRSQKKHGEVINERRGSHMSYIEDSTSSALNSSSDTASYSSSTETAPSNTCGMKTSTMTKKGKEKAAKVSKTETANNTSKLGINKPVAIALNPRLPTPPPPTVPINPYPLLRHVRGEPAPPAHHPASRLLSAISSVPPGYQLYSPAHPQQTATANLQHKSQSARHQRVVVHCRHWCHHGSCKYGPDCRYEHSMPRTHEGLREVGLADLPNWYKAALEMARDMQQKLKNNSRRAANKVQVQGKGASSAVDVMTTAAMVMGEGGGNTSSGPSRRKVSSSSVAVANDVSSPSTVAHTTNSEKKKTVFVEERLGRLASVASGDEGDGSSSSSAGHGDRELEVHQKPVTKKQDMAEDITAPVEKLVDI